MADHSFIPDGALATRDIWLSRVEAVLKGADFDKKLVGHTADAIRIEPLYAKSSNLPPLISRAPGTPWASLARIDHPDASQANQQALTDLEQGASGLSLVFEGAVNAYGFGLPATVEAVDAVLEHVLLDVGADLVLDPGPHGKAAIQAMAQVVKSRNVLPVNTKIRFGLDPLGAFAVTGQTPGDGQEIAKRFSAAVIDLRSRGFMAPIVKADGRIIHAAGGSEAQELAYALSAALFYLRGLEQHGMDLDEARQTIEFRLAADSSQFLTMAKFRALRLLWARVEQACGLKPQPACITGETAWRMMTQREPWVNILRSTVAVFAAGLGGANAITVLPFTQSLGLPDAFARRIARNTQTVLIEESHLDKVTDPAAGSGGVEALTQELTDKAWALFQSIESEGGIFTSLTHGQFVGTIKAVSQHRDDDLAKRKQALTGTSEFPDINEVPVAVLAPLGVLSPQGLLPPRRLSEPFEALRDASDRMQASTGHRPAVFLANLGPIAAFTARSQFAKNFFEAGGIETIPSEGDTDYTALAEAFRHSGATVACLCSSDEVYGEHAVPAALALKAAGANRILLAGRPAALQDQLKQAGIDDFIAVGVNLLKILSPLQDHVQQSQVGGSA